MPVNTKTTCFENIVVELETNIDYVYLPQKRQQMQDEQRKRANNEDLNRKDRECQDHFYR